jgi:hypothetical protein
MTEVLSVLQSAGISTDDVKVHKNNVYANVSLKCVEDCFSNGKLLYNIQGPYEYSNVTDSFYIIANGLIVDFKTHTDQVLLLLTAHFLDKHFEGITQIKDPNVKEQAVKMAKESIWKLSSEEPLPENV